MLSAIDEIQEVGESEEAFSSQGFKKDGHTDKSVDIDMMQREVDSLMYRDYTVDQTAPEQITFSNFLIQPEQIGDK